MMLQNHVEGDVMIDLNDVRFIEGSKYHDNCVVVHCYSGKKAVGHGTVEETMKAIDDFLSQSNLDDFKNELTEKIKEVTK